MVARVRALLRPPVFDDDDLNRQASLANLVAWSLVGVGIVYAVVRIVGTTDGLPINVVAPIGIAVAASLATLFLIHRGRVVLGSILLVSLVWLTFTFMGYTLGGVRDPAFSAHMAVIVLAGLLLGARGALIFAALSAVAGYVMADLETGGTLTYTIDLPLSFWRDYLVLFALTALLMIASESGFRRLLGRVRENEREVRSRNWELMQIRASLEERVEERTQELNRRSRYLEAAAQVAYASGEILDTEALMTRVVELIRTEFGLYYVGLFTLDTSGDWALLRAGTGEAGQVMLARGHRIRVGEGMVGWSIANGQSRFAQHAEQDGVRLATPELPDTRAEAALPLRARGRVIGALTVQSADADFFDEATVTVLQMMADLVAVTLSNAELYEESQEAVQAARRAYGQLSREAWSELQRARLNWGYHYVDGAVKRTADDWRAESRQAFASGEAVIREEGDVSALALPIRIRGAVIGAISFRREAARGTWNRDEVALLEALMDQLAQALDSARLLEESRARALREEQLNEIVGLLTASVDVESIMQTAVRELGRLPGVAEVSVHLEAPQPAADAGV